MASGDTLFVLDALGASLTDTNYCAFDIITDGSTPATNIPVLAYDGSNSLREHADWWLVVPSQYAGTTGFDFQVWYASDGATAGTVEWEIRVQKLSDLDVLTGDLGIDTQTAVTITDTKPATPTGKLNITAAGSLAKANMSTPVAGDVIVIRVTRDGITDTDTDDAHLLKVLVTET